ncbi:uncharacterized protein CCR75_002728 [Bremia lactucae]|uniref:RxLR effector protein n=1 Tax=Bremia lactucae TaxID=4779 RepID=A0A976IBM6_BRELC|nr:hypothetical protein CCR75_002728 [Bremia lactucae]
MRLGSLVAVIVIACVATRSSFAGAKSSALENIDYGKRKRLRSYISPSFGKTDASSEERNFHAHAQRPGINITMNSSSWRSKLLVALFAIPAALVAIPAALIAVCASCFWMVLFVAAGVLAWNI